MDVNLVLIPVIAMMLMMPLVSSKSALAFMTSEPMIIGMPDINHTCPNNNSINSCFQIGRKSGFEAGKEMKATGLLYSLVGGVGGQHSPNFSLGYLMGYNKGFGMTTNATYITSIATKMGFEDGGNANSATAPLVY